MRDWLLPMLPVAAIIYFTAFPDQFYAFVSLAQRFTH
jgi:hypothetical protein